MLRALESPEPLRRYLACKAEIRALTEEVKALEPLIYDALTDEDDGKAEAFGYALEACVSRTYAYSEAVAELEAEVRRLKAAERAAGTATVERATGYVRVTECRPVEAVEVCETPAGPLPF